MGSHGAAVASEKPLCIFLSTLRMKPIQMAISWSGSSADRSSDGFKE